MNRKNRILCLLLTAVLMIGALAGCGSQEKLNQNAYDTLRGSWRTEIFCSDDTTKALLENIDLYDEEIALIDLTGPKLVKIATFTDGTYRFDIDTDGVRENVRQYFADVFGQLYENRAELNELYAKEFDDMSQADFESFYLELYGFQDMDAMLDYFADNAFDYEAMAVVETGTYYAESKTVIYCTPNESDASAGTLQFTIGGDSLNIRFADGDEVYTRISE